MVRLAEGERTGTEFYEMHTSILSLNQPEMGGKGDENEVIGNTRIKSKEQKVFN